MRNNLEFKRLNIQLILTLSAIMAFFACLRSSESILTSTSVTTGNPSGIRIDFEKDSIPFLISGKVEIFAADQIPAPGYSPNPLIKLNVVESQYAEIEGHSIISIPDSLWPASSIVGDSIRVFNAVISSDSLGQIVDGIVLKKNAEGYAFSRLGGSLTQEGAHSVATAELVPLTDYVGRYDTETQSLGHNYFLFLYGTGYVSIGRQGVFHISGLPIGKHQAFIIPLPFEDQLSDGTDSTNIFGLIGGIDTERDSLYRGPVVRMVELPDSLKTK